MLGEEEELEEAKNYREIMYQAIQNSIEEREELDGSLLLGFTIIAEWQAPDGHKWLTKLSGDAIGELPPWRERMFGHELISWELYGSSDFEKEEDE